MTENQKLIKELYEAMRDMQLEKNLRYGDAALSPLQIFSKDGASNSIKVRLDDKLARIKNRKEDEPKINDVCDIIGYCILLLMSMGATKEDIAKLVD